MAAYKRSYTRTREIKPENIRTSENTETGYIETFLDLEGTEVLEEVMALEEELAGKIGKTDDDGS